MCFHSQTTFKYNFPDSQDRGGYSEPKLWHKKIEDKKSRGLCQGEGLGGHTKLLVLGFSPKFEVFSGPQNCLTRLPTGRAQITWWTFRIFFIFSARGGGRGSLRRREGGVDFY